MKTIVRISAVLALLAAALLLIVRYYEIKKASAEATQAAIAVERARTEAEKLKTAQNAPTPASTPSLESKPTTAAIPLPSVDQPARSREPAPASVASPDRNGKAPVAEPLASLPKSGPKPDKEVFTIGEATLELTSSLMSERRVLFVFVARGFGSDFTPISNWISSHGGVYEEKIRALGKGMGVGVWKVASKTWPPRFENRTATFEVVFERQ